MSFSDLPKPFQVTRRRRDDTHITGNRFEHDGRYLITLRITYLSNPVNIVERQNRGVFRIVVGDARARRDTQRRRARPGCDQQSVGMAVVAAFKLDDPVPTGMSSRQPNGAHGRFRSRVHQPDLLNRRQRFADFASELGFLFRRRAEAGAAPERRSDRLDHRRMRMPENKRPP